MKILFDQNVPLNLHKYLPNHDVQTAEMVGWDRWTNGDLLLAAEQAAYTIFVTCDQSLRYQQNLAGRSIAIVEISLAHWPSIMARVAEIVKTVEACTEGDYRRVECPYVRSNQRLKG